MNVLLTTVDVRKSGGVAAFFKAAQPFFSESVEYCVVGSRTDDESILTGVGRFIGDMLKVRKLLKTGTYDLVHLNPSLGLKCMLRDGISLLTARSMKIPAVVFFHGWDRPFAEQITGWLRWPFRLLLGRANAIVVLAHEFEQVLRKCGITRPIHVETTLVDESLLTPDDSEENSPKKNGSPVILFLSRVERVKGIFETLNAFAEIRRKHPGARLIVAGNGSASEAAESYAKEKGIAGVEFVGNRTGEAKRKVFLESDIYVLPTTDGEGMPLALLEAMAFGLPVVTRPVGGIKDFFKDGEMGYLTESVEAADFARLLDVLISDKDKANRMGSINRQYAREHFLASRVVKRIEHIYYEVISERTRGKSEKAAIDHKVLPHQSLHTGGSS